MLSPGAALPGLCSRSWDQTGRLELASLQLAHPAPQQGPQKSLVPGADTSFKWVGHSFLWAPSSHLPIQVKGGHGRGWAGSSYIKFCAILDPSPSLPHTQSLCPAGSLSCQHKEAICAAASGRGAGRTVWVMSLAGWVMAGTAGCGKPSDQDSAKHGMGGWALPSNSQATHPFGGGGRNMDASKFPVASVVPGGGGPISSQSPHWPW